MILLREMNTQRTHRNVDLPKTCETPRNLRRFVRRRTKLMLNWDCERGVDMSTAIPDNFRDLFQKKAFAHLATLMKDGTPQVTPVWCDFDGTHVIVNSAKGRTKDKNMRRNPNVALSVQDPDNPYRYV